jgi:hypothetical protein
MGALAVLLVWPSLALAKGPPAGVIPGEPVSFCQAPASFQANGAVANNAGGPLDVDDETPDSTDPPEDPYGELQGGNTTNPEFPPNTYGQVTAEGAPIHCQP